MNSEMYGCIMMNALITALVVAVCVLVGALTYFVGKAIINDIRDKF
jgi:hypothetical protein